MNHLASKISYLLLAGASLMYSCSRPMASFTYSGEKSAPARIKFTNLSEKAESFEWDFGDGTIVRDSAPSHRYTSSGNFLVRLKATNAKEQDQDSRATASDRASRRLSGLDGNALWRDDH